MIKKIISKPPIKKKEKPKYGRFFLMFEAPGDEEEKTDEQNGEETPSEETPAPAAPQEGETEPTSDTAPAEDTTNTDNATDADTQPAEADPGQDADTTDNGEGNDENQDSSDGGDGTNDAGQDAGDEGGGDGDAGGEEGGEDNEPDSDFDDLGQDVSSTAADTDTDDENQDKKGPGLEYESTRKHVLFKEYISLYNALNNYISKLDNMINDDLELNRIISQANNRLKEIRTLVYDYMIIKYEISSYTQSLVFYQTIIVSVQMVFKLLQQADITKSTDSTDEIQ